MNKHAATRSSTGVLDTLKNPQLVASLRTNRQQVVLALPGVSYQQFFPNMLKTCNKLDENVRLVTRWFQQI